MEVPHLTLAQISEKWSTQLELIDFLLTGSAWRDPLNIYICFRQIWRELLGEGQTEDVVSRAAATDYWRHQGENPRYWQALDRSMREEHERRFPKWYVVKSKLKNLPVPEREKVRKAIRHFRKTTKKKDAGPAKKKRRKTGSTPSDVPAGSEVPLPHATHGLHDHPVASSSSTAPFEDQRAWHAPGLLTTPSPFGAQLYIGEDVAAVQPTPVAFSGPLGVQGLWTEAAVVPAVHRESPKIEWHSPRGEFDFGFRTLDAAQAGASHDVPHPAQENAIASHVWSFGVDGYESPPQSPCAEDEHWEDAANLEGVVDGADLEAACGQEDKGAPSGFTGWWGVVDRF